MDIAVFLGLAFTFIALSFYITLKVAKWFFSRHTKRDREAEMRFIIACLFCIIAISELIQLHAIVAAMYGTIRRIKFMLLNDIQPFKEDREAGLPYFIIGQLT